MEKYISIDKRSKKEQKRFYSIQRLSWNGLNPATRVMPDKKKYNRNKSKNDVHKNVDFE